MYLRNQIHLICLQKIYICILNINVTLIKTDLLRKIADKTDLQKKFLKKKESQKKNPF